MGLPRTRPARRPASRRASNFPGTVGVGGSARRRRRPARCPADAVRRRPDFGPGGAAGSALDLALGSLDGAHDLAARLTALEEEGKGRVISRPRVVTLNNVAATIQSLTILRVKLPSTGTVINTGAGGAAGTASTATEKINTGITLVVTPQVSSDGFVLLNIYAKSSQPDFTRTVDGIPTEITPRGELERAGARRRDGRARRHLPQHRATIAQTGVPFLGASPVLGWLFKRTLTSKRREELLVFLTPRVLAARRRASSGGELSARWTPRGAARVILTGFMGTGKTEVGRRLARRLGRPFVDTDALVEAAAGRSVAAIFAERRRGGVPRARADGDRRGVRARRRR